MSGPASLFLFVASIFAPSCLLAVPVPYMAPLAKAFGIEIRSPLQNLKLVYYVEQLVCISNAYLYRQIVGKGSMVPLGGPLDAVCYSGGVQQA